MRDIVERLHDHARNAGGDDSFERLYEEEAIKIAAEISRLRTANASLELVAKQMREALWHAKGFISNGIELGFIRMPDEGCPDPAKLVPGIVNAALALTPSTAALDAYVEEVMEPVGQIYDVSPPVPQRYQLDWLNGFKPKQVTTLYRRKEQP